MGFRQGANALGEASTDLLPSGSQRYPLKTVDELLKELAEPGAGVTIKRGQLDAVTFGQLTKETGDEFSLWIMEDGTRMLFRGQGNRAFVPDNGRLLIAHTHPGMKFSPSYSDYEVIKDLPQRSSAIVTERGTVIRWFKSWFEE